MEYYSDFESLVDDVFEEFFDSLEDSQKVSLWNDYCEMNDYLDEFIYDMASLDDLCCGLTPTDLLSKLGKDFNVNHNYFRDDIYGLESFDYPDNYIDTDCLQSWFTREYRNIDDNDFFKEYCEENEYDLEENRDNDED